MESPRPIGVCSWGAISDHRVPRAPRQSRWPHGLGVGRRGFSVATAATITLSCGTDNQGNSYLLDRMLTSKYPLAVILMALAHQMRRRRLVLRCRWLPRFENEEVDALTNTDFHHFDPIRRIDVVHDYLGFKVLPMLVKAGEDYLADLDRSKL